MDGSPLPSSSSSSSSPPRKEADPPVSMNSVEDIPSNAVLSTYLPTENRPYPFHLMAGEKQERTDFIDLNAVAEKQRENIEGTKGEQISSINQVHPPFTSMFSATFQNGASSSPPVEAVGRALPVAPSESIYRPIPTVASSTATGGPSRGLLKSAFATSPSVPLSTSSSRTSAIAARQEELQATVSQHIEILEHTVVMREEEIAAAHRKLAQLEEDYQFNLSLISERDEALAEASNGLSRAYGELTSVKIERDEACRLQQRSEEECQGLRETVHHLEMERERESSKWRTEAGSQIALWERKYQELQQAMKVKGDEEHTHYMALVAELEEERERLRASREATQHHYETSLAEMKKVHEREQRTIREQLLQAIKLQEVSEQEKAKVEAHFQELQRDVALQQQRHAIVVEAQQKGKEQEREMLMKEMDERIGSVDVALRAAVAGRQDAEQAREALTARVVALEKEVLTQKQEYELATAQWEASRGDLESKVASAESIRVAAGRQRQADCQRLEEECQTLRQDLLRAQREGDELRTARDENRENVIQKEREVDRLTEEVRHWKDEEERTAARGKTNLLRTMERVQELEDAIEEMKDTMRLQQTRFHDITENANGEATRLRQELHASEVARAALEEQWHLFQDTNKTQLLLEGTREEKEQLAKRVLELERVNAEVRQQVATFTLELQNDPILKGAKENVVQISELQRQLLEAQYTHQVLQEKLREREEELARTKVQLLHHSSNATRDSSTPPFGTTKGTSTAPTTTTTTVSPSRPTIAGSHAHPKTAVGEFVDTHGHTCASTVEQEHEVLRAMYENLKQQVKASCSRHSRYLLRERTGRRPLPSHTSASRHEKGERRKKASASSSTRSSCSEENSSFSSSSAVFSSEASHHPGEVDSHLRQPPTPGGSTQRCPSFSHPSRRRRRRRRGGHRGGSKRVPNSRGTSPSFPSSSRSSSIRVREEAAEVWRKKCIELEWYLQQMIQQRDAAQRQVTALELEKAALLRQVRSLTELNTFLKSQWKQQQEHRALPSSSYITSTSKPISTALPASAHSGVPLDVSPAIASALLRLLSSPSQLQQFLHSGVEPAQSGGMGGASVSASYRTPDTLADAASLLQPLHDRREGTKDGATSREHDETSEKSRGDPNGRVLRGNTTEEEAYADRLRAVEAEIATMQYRIVKNSKHSAIKARDDRRQGGERGGRGETQDLSHSPVGVQGKGVVGGTGSSRYYRSALGQEKGTRTTPSTVLRESLMDAPITVRRGYGAVRHYGVP